MIGYWRLYYSSNPKWNYLQKQAQRANELGIAIPNTGRHTYGSYFRYPKHHQAYKQYAIEQYELKEYDVKISTPKQGLPPNDWDDITRSDWYNHKNWKKYRKHQWK